MRRSIETAPKDGQVVIPQDGASGAFDVGQRLPEAGGWVVKNGEPIKITLGPAWRRSRRRFAAYSITAALLLAALICTFFRAEVAGYGMRYAGLQDIRRKVVEKNAQARNRDSPKTNSLARQQQAIIGQACARATEEEA